MGTIRQRKDGLWEGRYTSPDGRQRSVYAKSEGEVSKKLRSAQHEIDKGSWREPSKMSVLEWLDIWLNDYQGHVSPRTVAKYRCIVNKHFKPRIGQIKLVKLLPMHIQRMITAMDAEGRATSTIRNYCAVLEVALRCAVDTDLIKTSPMAKVKLPRAKHARFDVVDRAQMPDFIRAASETDYPHELLTMIYTGMRVGEIRGLRWSDVDLDQATIHIQRQLHPKNKELERFGGPKYNEDREIHLPAEAVDVLKQQRKRQAKQRLAAGINWQEDGLSRDLVFRLKSGKPHNEKSLFRTVRAVGVEIGIPDLHPHDLRHSYAVAALRAGVDVKTVQHNLGHKTSQMTLDVYAAYTSDAGKAGAEKLSAYLKTIEN